MYIKMVQNSSAIYYKKIKQNATKKTCKKLKKREKEKKITVHLRTLLNVKTFLNMKSKRWLTIENNN